MVNREIKKKKTKKTKRERIMYFDWDRMVVVEELVAAEEELGRPESNPAEAGRQ